MNILPLAAPQSQLDNPFAVLLGLAVVLVLGGFILIIARRYKRCPSNKILVIYGKTGAGQSSRCMHGGGAFVWPLIQNYDYLSLDPIQIEIPLKGALSLENIRISVPSVFTVAVGTDREIMENAAVRLLGLTLQEVSKQAEEIIFGQLRQVIASMRIEEINRDREVFLSKVQTSLEPELAKIGQVLINVNIRDITDESGYIEAIGRKAASEAVQQALIDVSQQEQKGSIGVAEAQKEQAIQVAEREKVRDIGTKTAERERAVKLAELDKERIIGEQAAKFQQEATVRDSEREMRVSVAGANAQAVTGENEAKSQVARANADLQTAEAEAYQRGETRRREAEAGVREAQYLAEAKAAEAEATKIEAEKRAELEAAAKAQKAQTIVDAEAHAERRRIEAQGEAAAIFARLEAEAKGNYEVLARKGEGMRELIQACGGTSQAFQMLMLEHIDHISETAAKAIANIKFDKIVVWDGNGGEGGSTNTANFVRSLAGALPPALQMMKDIGGVDMPEFLGKIVAEDSNGPPAVESPAEPQDETEPPAGTADGG
ncbi:MAG: flotillin family protein [bacterium]|nr:flotillin family protein [bacterium]